MKRLLKNSLAFAVILMAAVAAYLYYSPGDGPQVKGVTTDEKFQSVAKIVSDRYSDTAMVVYIRPNIPVFVIASAVPMQDIKTQQENLLFRQRFFDAIAMTLKLTATEVLPMEPSIQAVGITVVMGGKSDSYYAKAEDLKATPADAEYKTWMSKLNPIDQAGSSQTDSRQNGSPSTQAPASTQ